MNEDDRYVRQLEDALFNVCAIALASIATHGKRDEKGLTGYSLRTWNRVVELGKVNRREGDIFAANGECPAQCKEQEKP